MSLDDVAEQLAGEKDARNKWVGVYIGILAVLLAICNVGGGNATKDVTANEHRGLRYLGLLPGQEHPPHRHDAGGQRAGADAGRAAGHAGRGQEEVRGAGSRAYRTEVQRLTTDPAKKEGLDELFAKAKALEIDRDVALRKDPYFDWSQALLQIAIVLASVHLIIGNFWLLGLSGGLGGLGLLLMLNGFTLAVKVPFVG